MKKVLSFVLVLAMILGSVSMVFAGAIVTVVTPENTVLPFEDAEGSMVATVLRDMGVLTGSDGKAALKNTLTRAEAATLVIKALGVSEAEKTATKFKDVPATHWASGFIAKAEAMGLVSGISKTEFAPDRTISVDECVALIVKALGYSDAHLIGVWPANFRSVAVSLNILANVTVGGQDATRGDLFQVLYNALDKHQVVWTEADKTGYYYNGLGQVKDEDQQGTLTLFQLITNSGKDLDDIYNTKDAKTGLVAYGITGKLVVGGNNVTFDNGYTLNNVIGKDVTLLKKGSSYIGLAKINSTALDGQFKKANGVWTFEANGKTYDLDANCTSAGILMINGEVTTRTDLPAYTSLGAFVKDKDAHLEVRLNAAKDTIVTICSISGEVADAEVRVGTSDVSKITAALANRTSKSDVTLFGQKFLVTKSGVNYVPDTTTFVVEGAVSSLDDIEKDDIVTIYTRNSGVAYKVVVAREVVEAVITNINTPANVATIGYTTFTFDNGKSYTATKANKASMASLITDEDIASKNAFKLYLNAEGKVADCEAVTVKVTTTTAIVLNVGPTNSTYYDAGGNIVEGTAMQILGLDGTVTSYTVAEDCTTPTDIGFDIKTCRGLVDFTLNKKGEINYLTPAGTEYVGATAYANYISLEKTAGTYTPKNYGSTVVVMMDDAEGEFKASDKEFYTFGTTADIAGKTLEGKVLVTEDTKKNVAVVVVSAEAIQSTETTETRAYAFLNKVENTVDGMKLTMADGNAYLVAKDATVATKYTDLMLVTLSAVTGKITAVTDTDLTPVNYPTITTPSEIKIVSNLVTVSSTAIAGKTTEDVLMIADDAVFYIWNAVKGYYEATGSIEDLYSAQSAKFYDVKLNAKNEVKVDGVYDIVVLTLYVED